MRQEAGCPSLRWHSDACDRLGGNSLAASGEAQALAGCRLDAHLSIPQPEDLSDAGPHCGAVGTDLWLLGDDRAIDMVDGRAEIADQLRGMAEEEVACCALPA